MSAFLIYHSFALLQSIIVFLTMAVAITVHLSKGANHLFPSRDVALTHSVSSATCGVFSVIDAAFLFATVTPRISPLWLFFLIFSNAIGLFHLVFLLYFDCTAGRDAILLVSSVYVAACSVHAIAGTHAIEGAAIDEEDADSHRTSIRFVAVVLVSTLMVQLFHAFMAFAVYFIHFKRPLPPAHNQGAAGSQNQISRNASEALITRAISSAMQARFDDDANRRRG